MAITAPTLKPSRKTASNGDEHKETTQSVTISPPKFVYAAFMLIGTAPLVIHRMGSKYRNMQREKIMTGKAASSKKNREAQKPEDIFNAARYRHKDGWDGIHAGGFRAAMIRACSLVGFKMTLAKLSLFVEADGWDSEEPQIPLVRILEPAEPDMQEDVVRMANGDPNLAWRPVYHNWKARLRIRFDTDQFTLEDVTNLIARVGMQVGIGEGRPSSPNSCGMGWGLFNVEASK